MSNDIAVWAPETRINLSDAEHRHDAGRWYGDAAHLCAVLNEERGQPMDWNRVEGNWKQIKGKVKEQWGNLTDDDLDKIAGKREQLEGKLQERYGLQKDAVRKQVDDWYSHQTWN
jgi:uncharacterized protein YjbJ (UPF0337 family)